MAATQNLLTRRRSAVMRMMIAGVLASLAICAHANAEAKGRRLLEPLNYQGVTLTQGRLARQFEEVCEYYLHIPNDDLLKPYRQRAGINAPGADMGGCYVGHNPFGQFLSGFARMYAATRDAVYKDKAIRVHYFKYDDAGRFEVTIDGKAVGVLDVYGPKRGETAFADFAGLPDSRHTLRMTLLSDKSPESKGIFVNVSAFETIE